VRQKEENLKIIILYKRLYFLSLLVLMFSCKDRKAGVSDEKVNPVTPVKVVSPETGSIKDYLELNATSSFLRKEFVKSTANGYISEVRVAIGDKVHKGQELFIVQTKESRALGNYKKTYDTSLHFSGLIPVTASKDGVVSAITHQKGDYVQDGDPLATISEGGSMVFLIDAPYEYHKYLTKNKSCSILLPDGNSIPGVIKTELPMMDVGSQTQNYVVSPLNSKNFPEGLIARIRILKTEKGNAQTLPKAAVLTDEKEENFWVMKLINDSTAVKVPVQTGMQNNEKLEIVTPIFSPSDRILVSGNYGLEDTAKVKIIK
jgi:multidrug efflux pump subunit AcrA (membrane-fusion protein)